MNDKPWLMWKRPDAKISRYIGRYGISLRIAEEHSRRFDIDLIACHVIETTREAMRDPDQQIINMAIRHPKLSNKVCAAHRIWIEVMKGTTVSSRAAAYERYVP